MMRSMLNSSISFFVGMFFLSACVSTPAEESSGFRSVSEKDGLVFLDDSKFHTGAKERVVYSTAWELEEYALYKAPTAHAEFVYISTKEVGSRTLYIDRFFDLNGPMKSFRHNQVEQLILGEAFRVNVNNLKFWAKPFQLPATEETCAVFSGSWGLTRSYHRQSKALFGFYCDKGNKPLSSKVIGQFMETVKIRGVTANEISGSIDVGLLDTNTTQASLIARAHGNTGQNNGNTNFPYRVVKPFVRDVISNN